MAKVLYIEDELSLRNDIAEELSDEGYEVLTAEDGQQGLELILDHNPDLVLCDINMPKMTGWELLEELNKNYSEFRGLRFIFLSAVYNEEDKLRGLRLGAVDYLIKPIDLDLLMSKIETHLQLSDRLRRSPDD